MGYQMTSLERIGIVCRPETIEACQRAEKCLACTRKKSCEGCEQA